MSVSVLFLAGGLGSRMNHPLPKQYLPLNGIPLATYSFETFKNHIDVCEIIVACAPEYEAYFASSPTVRVAFAPPGQRRQDSVFNALQRISVESRLVCIHDSARPFLSLDDLKAVLKSARTHGAATLGRQIHGSMKRANEEQFIAHTLDREGLWEMHTPQVATPELLRQGFAIAHARNLTVTDDNALIELTGHAVKIVSGSPYNLKITTLEDLRLAEALVGMWQHA